MLPTDPDSNVVSLSGGPIYHHDQESEWQPPQGEMCLEEISAHIDRYLGPVETVFHELVSDTVHVDIHNVKPTLEQPYIRLVTSGMSDLPMTVPDGVEAPRYAELMVTLPAAWRVGQADFESEAWYWPVRLLKYLARLPHKHATWLGFGHTIPNGNPAEPYAETTTLCGAIVVPSVTVPADFQTLAIDETKTITFYSVVPLYLEEMNFKLRSGADALFEKFDAKGVNDRIDINRVNVVKKRFGIF